MRKKNKVRMKKKFKIILTVLILSVILIVSLILVKKFLNTSTTNTIDVVDTIDEYGYTLDARDTTLMKNTYNELKDCLQEDDIDYELYATLLAKLFVIDLFTMDNKINKYDVGSAEYVYPDAVDNFKMNVEDTIYKSMEDNTSNNRDQDLPIVSSIIDTNIEEAIFTIDEVEYDAYTVYISWEYKKNLGYDSEATITLIKLDNMIYVVEYSEGIDE